MSTSSKTKPIMSQTPTPPSSSPPGVPSKPSENNQALVIAAVAFFLTYQQEVAELDEVGKRAGEDVIAEVKAKAASRWQQDAAYRREHFAKAERVVDLLDSLGVRVRSANIGALNETMEFMRTIPARKAYELDEFRSTPAPPTDPA